MSKAKGIETPTLQTQREENQPSTQIFKGVSSLNSNSLSSIRERGKGKGKGLFKRRAKKEEDPKYSPTTNESQSKNSSSTISISSTRIIRDLESKERERKGSIKLQQLRQ